MFSFSIIQGGMGVAVSNWRLARAVSTCGELGVVSGTGIAAVLARRLQLGDVEMVRGLEAFPFPAVGRRIIEKYFVAGGKGEGAAFKAVPVPNVENFTGSFGGLTELTVAANFVEVWLAKEGHGGVVGINYLEKVQTPHLASLFGAMLAGVDYVLMGAGIPRFIPGVLDAYARGEGASYRVDVEGGEACEMRFEPAVFAAKAGGALPGMRRPKFFPIVSSATLAATLARKSNGAVDGFVVETAVAGGHNAPPRGPLVLNGRGEPVYGARDEADLGKMRELGLPFFLGGGYGHAGKLAEARGAGAAGIQVGTAFAFCAESGLETGLKGRAVRAAVAGEAEVFTDPRASPTGFPIKLLQLEGTLSEAGAAEGRERVCDLGYLRKAYRRGDGTVGYRCAGEPVADFVGKGGTVEETEGRKCLCNALFANIGLGQVRGGVEEGALVTAGEDVGTVGAFLGAGAEGYGAKDVIARLRGEART